MLIGIAAGVLSRLGGLAAPMRFSPEVFFYALLPPIVFAAGFTLKKRQFFRNLGPILMYAVVGTFISSIVFGLFTYLLVLIGVVRVSNLAGAPLVECLMYGSAISSIDPVATLAVLSDTEVPSLLYNLVFGESVLNDATAIVLFRSLERFYDRPMGVSDVFRVFWEFSFLGVGSLFIGIATALAAAFLLKRLERPGDGRGGHVDGTLYEIAIVIMSSYLAYLLAEMAGMTGIVALFFTGICHAHYSYYNVHRDARITLRKLTEFAAFACEMFVMAYLGLQVATMQHKMDLGLLVTGVPLAVLSRAANVFPCSARLHQTLQHTLPRNLQLMLWAVGLRGAVAYGLVVNLPRADSPGSHGIPAIETATLFIVVVSTLLLGSATSPLLEALELAGKDDEALLQQGLPSEATLGTPVHGGAAIETKLRSWAHEKFKELDDQILKPLFGGQPDRVESWVLDARQPGAFRRDDEGDGGLSWEPSEHGGSADSRTELSVSARRRAPPQRDVDANAAPFVWRDERDPGHETLTLEAHKHGGVFAAAAAMGRPASPTSPRGASGSKSEGTDETLEPVPAVFVQREGPEGVARAQSGGS